MSNIDEYDLTSPVFIQKEFEDEEMLFDLDDCGESE